MLWSEIGSTPQIERSGMDGSKRKVVVSRDLSWPVSLAYDLLDNRVYWADEKLRCIGSSSLDGDNIKVKGHLNYSHLLLHVQLIKMVMILIFNKCVVIFQLVSQH